MGAILRETTIDKLLLGDRIHCRVRSEAMGRRVPHVYVCEPSRVRCAWCDLDKQA